ncbi:peptide-methionine (R)-S-oxide reductase [Litorivita pollutaquae]|uniref:peptide-methionine (R)-S-oxide reductase n=1 Tax=Litorivita pollutaquae TaxID=2200892 RepID=A0A2V4MST5_9RHOB|nr:peptide-methionine (R)-S-oxide reductase MsrB [Litorivita pollutaquae]OUS22108.1 peptide-methionine (R)-S-oxide reductase [Rhodobacterales bacterium 59_46_T64]PYC48579.1 peptide-methionine (R)-S-oxide reductase [Litorivita pollutaquae]
MERRSFLVAATAMGTLGLGGLMPHRSMAKDTFEVTRTTAEWKAMLNDLQYAVMREEATERAGTSPLDKNYADGMYHCRGCDLPVYSSEAKYDSGTGWPSFYQSMPDAIRTKDDRKLFSVRTECHCRRCGSHFGHIFDDGPEPTGKRHCLNGVSLVFKAA